MVKRLIDLSLTVDPEVKWVQFPRSKVMGAPEPPTKFETIETIEEHGFFVQRFETTTQSYTHIDAPNHCIKGGLANHEIPLEQLVGEAVVIDMSHKRPNEAVTAADLEASGAEVQEGDIAIIRTGWTDRAWGTERFWEEMIHLAPDACDWLISKGIKALAQDFMTDDHPLHPPPERRWPSPLHEQNHKKFLGKGIILIEWCTNLGAITKPRVTFICLPLKLKGTDGAPARVIAVEED
ncbi:MAG: cyclase family protein [Chloroflexi bacterium]|nr:cyclase family protein [Chloroflexota bacterium]MCL5075067.1 cyclase family protein [Chloroflexota bacterium]